MKKRERAEKRVPVFADEQEEAAAFWDTHSPLDFPDNFEEAILVLRVRSPDRRSSSQAEPETRPD